MLPLKQDLPALADEIVTAAKDDPVLAEALVDYEQACARMHDAIADKAVWAEIRAELVEEISLRYAELRTGH